MKKAIKLSLIGLLFLLFAFVFIGCGTREYTVLLVADNGAVITGEDQQIVTHGGTARFNVTIQDGYSLHFLSHGEFDEASGVLKISGVTSSINVSLVTKKLETNKEKLGFIFRKGYSSDSSSVVPASNIDEGTVISLSANNMGRIFQGWTVGASLSSGGTLVSTERQIDFTLDSQYAKNGVVTIYSNYDDADRLYYDINGGSANLGSKNLSGNKYYTVSLMGEGFEITYADEYLSFFECGSLFYDDGSFYREGYILAEFNTKADGTGTSYSLGSKAPLILDNEHPTYYCIWKEATPVGDFEYEEFYYKRPCGSTVAPHWVENGVKITKYKGDAGEVVIPETIDGKTVTAIGAGAFVDKNIETLVMGRRILKVEDGAFVGCSKLATIYYPDGLYSMSNEALDSASYTSLRTLYVNATLAPRFMNADTGALSVKLSRLLAPTDKPRIIVIAGSSAYQGLASEYLEDLLLDKYRVVNFGTTRTTHGTLYLEAMSALANSDDIILYAPENSTYMMGEGELYWKTMRDLESMVNIYRYVDFSNYSNFFGAFTDFNMNYRYSGSYTTPGSYEAVCAARQNINEYGEYQHKDREGYIGLNGHTYIDTYYITLNERMKSKDEGWWNDSSAQESNKDYTDKSNITWATITDPYFKDLVNHAIDRAKSSGAKVYFSFCPTDESALVEGADSIEWLLAYESMIDENYNFDGNIGTVSGYIYDHKYFYDCAFHPNDYGRAYRTYRLYVDLCATLGIEEIEDYLSVGTDFDGCLFEDSDGTPLTKWEPKN